MAASALLPATTALASRLQDALAGSKRTDGYSTGTRHYQRFLAAHPGLPHATDTAAGNARLLALFAVFLGETLPLRASSIDGYLAAAKYYIRMLGGRTSRGGLERLVVAQLRVLDTTPVKVRAPVTPDMLRSLRALGAPTAVRTAAVFAFMFFPSPV